MFNQKFLWKFFQGYHLWGNEFATIKIKTQIINRKRGKFYLEYMISCSISEKRHIPIKKCNQFLWNYFQGKYIWGNAFATIKHFEQNYY